MRRPVAIPFLLAAALALTAGASDASETNALHVPAPDGWTAVDQEYRYGRENLWEYINGAAEVYLTYRFREMVVADFERGDEALTVSVYDMGFPLDAYGIFEVEKPGKGRDLADAGAAAVLRPPYLGVLVKDRFFVKIEAGGDVDADALGGALRAVADGLPGDDALPPELAALPVDGRVPGSVRYAGSNFLGFADLGGCLHAAYDGGHRLFVMEPSPAFLRDERGKWSREERDGRLVFAREIPYEGVVVLMGDEERLLGVTGVDDVDTAKAILAPLIR